MRRATPRFLRRSILVVWASAVAGLAASACVDPKGEYEDYVGRTDGIRGKVPEGNHGNDGGANCPAPPGKAPDFSMTGVPDATGTFFGACLATIAQCDTHKVLRFRVDQTYDAATGKLAQHITPLVIDATSISQTVPPTFDIDATVAPDGTWSGSTSNRSIKGDANPFSHSDLTLDPIGFHGYVLSADTQCAEMDTIVRVAGLDSTIDLTGKGDICIYRRAAEGDSFNPDVSEYHCPLRTRSVDRQEGGKPGRRGVCRRATRQRCRNRQQEGVSG